MLLKGNGHNGSSLSDAIHSLPRFVPQKLAANKDWREGVADVISSALIDGCYATVIREARMSL